MAKLRFTPNARYYRIPEVLRADLAKEIRMKRKRVRECYTEDRNFSRARRRHIVNQYYDGLCYGVHTATIALKLGRIK